MNGRQIKNLPTMILLNGQPKNAVSCHLSVKLLSPIIRQDQLAYAHLDADFPIADGTKE